MGKRRYLQTYSCRWETRKNRVKTSRGKEKAFPMVNGLVWAIGAHLQKSSHYVRIYLPEQVLEGIPRSLEDSWLVDLKTSTDHIETIQLHARTAKQANFAFVPTNQENHGSWTTTAQRLCLNLSCAWAYLDCFQVKIMSKSCQKWLMTWPGHDYWQSFVKSRAKILFYIATEIVGGIIISLLGASNSSSFSQNEENQFRD